MLMAKALDHLAKAKKSDADLIGKLRDQARKEARTEAAEVVESVARRHGLSDEAKQAIRAELGIGA